MTFMTSWLVYEAGSVQVAKKTTNITLALLPLMHGPISAVLIDVSMDMPFLDAEPGEIYEVTFQLTRDMYWFDAHARNMRHSPCQHAEDSVFEASLD